LLDGEPNPNYAPRVERTHTDKNPERPVPKKAIYLGLVGTYYEGEWRGATVAWRRSIQDYTYNCHFINTLTIQELLWARHVRHFDRVITDLLHEKLRATFDEQVWQNVLEESGDDFEAERRQLNHQLASINNKMQTIIGNFSQVTIPSLLQALQQEYANHEKEKYRLEAKLTTIDQREAQQKALSDLAKQVDNVLLNWEQLGVDERRAVARAFITRIVVTPQGKNRVVDVRIEWRDNSFYEFVLPYRSDTWTLWLPSEIDMLKELMESEATQVEIAAALPTRNWRAIRIKIYEIIGFRRFHISPKPIRDAETYEDYLKRVERDGDKVANRTSGNRWRDDELEILAERLDAGATQLEIAAALPDRTWEAIRKKIVKLRGPGFDVPETGQLENGETIADFLERNPEAAGAMSLLISENCSPRRRC
jgi:hypothetical protein